MSTSTPQKPPPRRIVGMVVGIVIIGLGIALFKQSHLGNDSISALNMRLAELLGIKSPGKGVKVQINDGVITVDVIIMVRYGSNVVSVAKQVQDTVTGAVESMTGMGAPVVNVHVSGVAFDK